MNLTPNTFFSPKSQPQTLSYSFADGHHRLKILLSAEMKGQMEVLQTCPFEMAMVNRPGVLLLLCRLDKSPWMMAPFQWHRIPAIQRTSPDLWNEAQFHIEFVDAGLGRQLGSRTVRCGIEFSASFGGAILMQASTPWLGEEAYQQLLEELQKNYPTPEKLLPLCTARMLVLQ